MRNVFTMKWPEFRGMEDGRAAWRFSDEIYESALRGDFMKADAQQFCSLFKNYYKNEYGLIDICPDVYTDREVRVALWYVPSYALIAGYVYLKNQNPDCFDDEFNDEISKLMKIALERGIVGHGFDGYKMFFMTMLMFAKAGAKEFVERESDFSPEFTDVVLHGIEHFENELATIDDREIENMYWNPSAAELKMIINAWNGRPYPVFVYGSLMKGERASYMLDGYDCCGIFCLKDYGMYNVSPAFPGIKKANGEAVVGELYFVDDECLKRMDYYEGEGSLYIRESVEVERDNNKIKAFVYVYNCDYEGPVVRGKWNAKPDDEMWYACYGSNLSEERFRMYIEGGYFDVNGKTYSGCRNKELWTDEEFGIFPGILYFGNSSGSWFGSGVGFYKENNELMSGHVYMRLYKITWEQLLEVQMQEGNSPSWYGRRVCLGVHEDGCPIYTLTSECEREKNAPHKLYKKVMEDALIDECGLDRKTVKRYLNR